MRALARHLAPAEITIDCGGEGQCGPNSIAYGLGLLDFATRDGVEQRRAVAEHLLQPAVQKRITTVRGSGGHRMTLGDLVVHSMTHWPERMMQSLPGELGKLTPSIPNYCRIIALPESWTDFAFLVASADESAVALQLVGVTDLSKVVDNFALALPCEGKQPRAVMRLGAWINRHLTMIAEAMPAAAADVSTLQGDFSPTTGNVVSCFGTAAEPRGRRLNILVVGCPDTPPDCLPERAIRRIAEHFGLDDAAVHFSPLMLPSSVCSHHKRGGFPIDMGLGNAKFQGVLFTGIRAWTHIFNPYEGEVDVRGCDIQPDRTEIAISELARCLVPFGYAQPLVAFVESALWIRRHEAVVSTWLGEPRESGGFIPIESYLHSVVACYCTAATTASLERFSQCLTDALGGKYE